MKNHNLLNKIFPFLAFFLGLWYFCLRILGYNFEYIPGDLGDSRYINFLLEHGFCWITGNAHSFWDGEFMYPFRNSIALSDSMIGTMPIYALWRLLGFTQESSYQLWWISICFLNFWISFFVFKKWFNNTILASILAWIFSFTIFNLGQLDYMQMIIRFAVSVCFYAAFKIINSPSLKYLCFYCLSILIQFYSVSYTGFYLFYFSILFIIIYFVLSSNKKDIYYYLKRNILPYSILIVTCTIFLLALLLIPYYNMSKIVGLRLFKETSINLPVWKSFLFPHEASIPWNFLFNIAKPNVENWWVHYLFSGFILFLVMILSPFFIIYNWEKNSNSFLLKSLIITSLIIVLLHIRFYNNLTLYALIFKLPGINSMRVLNRFMNVELFILLVILGYFAYQLKNSLLIILFILLFADNSFNADLIKREEKIKLIQRRENAIAEIKKYDYKKYEAVILVDSTKPVYISHLDMMLACQSLGIKTVNGYSSYCPDAFGEIFNFNTIAGLRSWLLNQNINPNKILIIKKNSIQ